MDSSEILSRTDHTLLAPTATWAEIRKICDEGIKYHTASVCIPASYVARASSYTKGRVRICTVIGFPNGYDTTAAKVFEAQDAVKNGADEVDMVINIGYVKDGLFAETLDEISQVKNACGSHILKVIVEACLLTEEEKVKMCEIVTESGANFIKTSTGFSTGGATFGDVALFKEHIGQNIRIKAAGGIRTLEDAEKFISLGADRLGTSRIVGLVQKQEAAEGKHC
ncbi:MAG TPA: deoxyribose-phosphate aldolase [Ruminococcaceae bacterium]|jgi:deoxyribose-phosphate aldolase|nr:deoxyribose-phosphate aldolase [Oscillospiraceae bacterium]